MGEARRPHNWVNALRPVLPPPLHAMADSGLSSPPLDDQPPTSEPEDVYDSDAANTENARVHLGPFDPATEQPMVLPKSLQTPLRPIRTNRKASAQNASKLAAEIDGLQGQGHSEVEDLKTSPRAATPDQATIFEGMSRYALFNI